MLTGWRGHLKIDSFIANTPVLGPERPRYTTICFQWHSGATCCSFFSDPVLLKVPFYSWQVHFVYLAELAKHLQSGFFNAGNAAPGSNKPHNGNWTWFRALRRGCVRFVLLLAPYLPSLMAGRRLCGLWARWVGALAKVEVSLPVCAHVRRETLLPTQLGVA